MLIKKRKLLQTESPFIPTILIEIYTLVIVIWNYEESYT